MSELYDLPGLPPVGDPLTLDIMVTSSIGVVYTGTARNSPSPEVSRATTPRAPSRLRRWLLGPDPHVLEAVQKEGAQVLPGFFGNNGL